MRPSDAHKGVDEILQADVMRFMAMISICLIAILALVRSVEPSVQAAEAPMAPAAVPVPEPRPAVAVRPATRTPTEPAEVMPVRAPAPAAPVQPPVETAPEPAAPPADESEPGLRLRFASDQDFLRLLNQGDIRVFAFRDGKVLSVGPDFRFHQAAAPGRLHELLPETIPDLMMAALRGAESSEGFRWGIAMPDRMARQIRSYVDRGASGDLVIDRFGEVRHHGT